jgi:hypothetical protein
VMGIAGLPPADQAGLPGNKAQVPRVARPPELTKGELVIPRLRLCSTDFLSRLGKRPR